MGGGSTTVEFGGKKEGPSPLVVTGVLRSPGGGSGPSGSARSPGCPEAGEGLPPWSVPTEKPPIRGYRQVSKLRTLKWCAAAAADSVSRKLWPEVCGARVSRPSMIMVAGESGAPGPGDTTDDGETGSSRRALTHSLTHSSLVGSPLASVAASILSAPRHSTSL